MTPSTSLLPRAVAELEHWQTAIARLIAAAEKRGIVMMGRIAVVQVFTAWEAGRTAGAAVAEKYRILS